MSRLSYAKRHPRRALGALATVLVAVGVAVGSGADFTAQSSNPTNTFTAGSLTIGNSDADAIFTVTNLKPGDSTTPGIVDIQNTGSIPGTFTLSQSTPVNAVSTDPLSDKLDLVVKDCGDFSSGTPTCDVGDTNVYDGTVTAFTTPAALGTFAANEKHRYQFVATLNSSADDTYQSGTTSVNYTWNAVQ